jgi:diaminopimelate epimerase
MIFYKTVASGNDFLHIDVKEYDAYVAEGGAGSAEERSKGALARLLCARHSGAGADGVVFYRRVHNTENCLQSVTFEIYNRDGSEAELSGNGMAGLSALMIHLDLFSDRVVLDTKVGRRTHRLLEREGKRFHLNIEIGPPDFRAKTFFPFLENEKSSYSCGGITFYPVSVGNPHAVVILEENTEDAELEKMGRMLERAAMFPLHTNVEFVLGTGEGPVDYESGENVRIFFYERGVGQTLASSTGSAAVFAVLRKLGKITDTLTIFSTPSTGSPGIGQKIKISGKNNIYVESYAQIVYKGIYRIESIQNGNALEK